MENNPDISNQIYDDCVTNWRNMHLGLFYAKIPTMLNDSNLKTLIDNFEFPKISNEYNLDKQMLYGMLSADRHEKGGLNSFSFFVIWNYLGNIFRAFSEGLKKENEFEEFIKDLLSDNFVAMNELVSFFRNFFSHNIDEKFRIHSDDIRAKKYRTLEVKLNIDSELLKLNGPNIKNNTAINFANMKSGNKLTDFVSFDEVFILSDFCTRLALDFVHYRTNKDLNQ